MKSIKSFIIITILIVVYLLIYMPETLAANLTIATSEQEAKEGETVTITVNGSGMTGKVKLSATGGELDQSSVWVENSKVTAKLKVTGNSDIRVTATPEDLSDSSTGEALNVSATGATIKIKQNTTATQQNTTKQENTNNQTNKQSASTKQEETKKSGNANLANLGIKPNDFSGFKTGTTTYSVTVPNNVEQVEVYAKVQDQKAKISSGTGNQKLNVGPNALNVVVTAEDGTKKTYTINVNREEKKEEEKKEPEQNIVEEETKLEEKSDLVKLDVSGYTLTPKFSPNVYEYKLTVKDNVDKLNIITEGANNNVKIEIAGNTDLKDGENTITVLVYNENTKKNSTYQIIVTKEQQENATQDINKSIQKGKKIRLILICIIGVGFLLILSYFIGRAIIKSRQSKYDDDYLYDEEDEEKINLDDEEGFFNRVTHNKHSELENEEEIETEKKVPQAPKKRLTKKESDETSVETINEFKKKMEIELEEKDENIETEEPQEQFFSASKPKHKGKHF